jgi:exodeoxyribonuclease V alpha subunit
VNESINEEEETASKLKSITLSMEQENAIDSAIDARIRIFSVTGGAGTGKTTILKNVHDALTAKRARVLLAAPTGRAAKRIQETTNIAATTIHRLLEFPAPIEVSESNGKVKFGEPKRHKYNPLPCDVLIIDEASMISSEIWRYVMDALPKHASIRLFGDLNQLPPIDDELPAGQSVFRRQLEEREHVYLSHNFRSDDNLIESANRILRGLIPIRGDKFELIITNDTVGALREYASPRFHRTDYQVITPKRVGSTGSVKLSSILRTKYNLSPDKPRLELLRRDSSEPPVTIIRDDKIIWTKNDYCLNIMNGELGIAAEIDPDEGELALDLDDRRHVTIPPSLKGPFGWFYDPRKQIDLAYCMTTHKSQGSEFEEVIYVMNRSQAWMLNRNNFYTGVTRARHKVTVICDRYALSYSMRKPRV